MVAIPGASSVEQLEHNAAAADLDLAPDEVEELSSLSAGYRPVGAMAAAASAVRRRSARSAAHPAD